MASPSDKKLSVDDLSPDQRDVYESLSDWVRLSPIADTLLTIGGFGGTGKSTLLGVFAAENERARASIRALGGGGKHAAYCTFTGRAASVLKRKLQACGVRSVGTTYNKRADEFSSRSGASGYFDGDPHAIYCGTIHRLLYRPMINEKEEIIGWSKRDSLDREYDLIVIDEASMVSDEMLEDFKRFGIPILAVGDHGQLPPVMASGKLMQNPVLRLEKIHRQAADNPVIALSKHVREGGSLSDWENTLALSSDPRVFFGSKKANMLPFVLSSAYRDAASPLDVGVLCWTNKNRVMLNGACRKAQGFSKLPKKGEVVMCLKNKPPVYNGMRGVLLQDSILSDENGASPWHLHGVVDFPEEGIRNVRETMCSAQFNREKTFSNIEDFDAIGIEVNTMKMAGSLYDFGSALTVHKSQGSSFDHVVLYLDRPERPDDEDWRRWAYTAITRSSNRLTVLL